MVILRLLYASLVWHNYKDSELDTYQDHDITTTHEERAALLLVAFQITAEAALEVELLLRQQPERRTEQQQDFLIRHPENWDKPCKLKAIRSGGSMPPTNLHEDSAEFRDLDGKLGRRGSTFPGYNSD
jgi:hypothetical protein